MAGEFAGNAEQIFLQNSSLTVGDDERGGFADFLNRSGVLAQRSSSARNTRRIFARGGIFASQIISMA